MTTKPSSLKNGGCSLGRIGMFNFGPPKHEWNYSTAWNGHNVEKFPMLRGYKRSIARAGWRCYHCGEFVWDEPDGEWGMQVGVALGLIKVKMRVRVPAICERVP